MKAITKIGLSLLGIFALYKGVRATSAYLVAEGMAVDIDTSSRVNPDGVVITSLVKISNPTDKSMTITSPFVQLLHQGERLSQNQVSGNKIEIKPFSQTSIPVNFQLSWTQISSLINSANINIPENMDWFNKVLWLNQNYEQIINSLGLKVKYSTYANGIPYSSTENIEI